MNLPLKVEVAAVAPVALDQVAGLAAPKATAPDQRVQHQDSDPSVPARTTFQEDLVTAGQRNVNLIWETTQGQIARFVILGTMFIDGAAAILSIWLSKDLTAAQALTIGFVNSLAAMVTSFYFSRTNHTAIGGIGPKPHEKYEGR